MIGLIFLESFLMLFLFAMVAFSIHAGRKEYARRKRERAEHDQKRFLGMGVLRRTGR